MNNYLLYISASYFAFVLIFGVYLWRVFKRHQYVVQQIKLERNDVEHA